MVQLRAIEILPRAGAAGLLVGRVSRDASRTDPRPVVIRENDCIDLSTLAPTVSDLFELDDVCSRIRNHQGALVSTLDDALATGCLLAPCDLQVVKAAGVTFAVSMLERVIEERAHGDAASARRLRQELLTAFDGNLAGVRPGSPAAATAKTVLVRNGLWSQYLEVAIGADAEIFTKAPVLSAVGCGADIGIHPRSTWSTPEPEIVLAMNSRGAIVGATLGNDLTMRDFEGRSALLLSRAKDNNASCAIGPFVRLFDSAFTLDDVRGASVEVHIAGEDGFKTEGVNSMTGISRDPVELVDATMGSEHQYPDGMMLFLGTMFVPTADRGPAGQGFTHKVGDIVKIRSPMLGTLVNRVTLCNEAPPWTFGIRALMRALAGRGRPA